MALSEGVLREQCGERRLASHAGPACRRRVEISQNETSEEVCPRLTLTWWSDQR